VTVSEKCNATKPLSVVSEGTKIKTISMRKTSVANQHYVPETLENSYKI
jgi:hypothetical protein